MCMERISKSLVILWHYEDYGFKIVHNIKLILSLNTMQVVADHGIFFSREHYRLKFVRMINLTTKYCQWWYYLNEHNADGAKIIDFFYMPLVMNDIA